MSKAYDLIAESLNEIITDLEKNDGKNLKRESRSLKIETNSPNRKNIDFTKYTNKGELIFKSTGKIDEYTSNYANEVH